MIKNQFSYFLIPFIYVPINHSIGSNVSKYEILIASRYGDDNFDSDIISRNVTPSGNKTTLISTTLPPITTPSGFENNDTAKLPTEPTADKKNISEAIYGGIGGACVVIFVVILFFLYKHFRSPRKGGRFLEF